jgi:DNA-binding CsgD family transcriptional regulator
LLTKEIDVLLYITPEERATLQLFADGKEANEIAVRLRVPESHIHELSAALVERLGAASRMEAVAAAAKRGLVMVDPALRAPTLGTTGWSPWSGELSRVKQAVRTTRRHGP